MMVADIYVEGDESDAVMGWHNHGIACVELAKLRWFRSVSQNFGKKKMRFPYAF